MSIRGAFESKFHRQSGASPLVFRLLSGATSQATPFSTISEREERKLAKKIRRNKQRAKLKAGAKSIGSKAKAYGPVFIATYLGVYVTTLSSIFLALDFDIFNAATFGMDAVQAVDKVCGMVEHYLGYEELPQYIRANPRVGTFALAWVMTKFTEPVRFGATVLVVPRLSRALGRSGEVEVEGEKGQVDEGGKEPESEHSQKLEQEKNLNK